MPFKYHTIKCPSIPFQIAPLYDKMLKGMSLNIISYKKAIWKGIEGHLKGIVQKLEASPISDPKILVEKLFGRIPFEQHFSYAEASLNPNTSKLVNISFVCVCEKEK